MEDCTIMPKNKRKHEGWSKARRRGKRRAKLSFSMWLSSIDFVSQYPLIRPPASNELNPLQPQCQFQDPPRLTTQPTRSISYWKLHIVLIVFRLIMVTVSVFCVLLLSWLNGPTSDLNVFQKFCTTHLEGIHFKSELGGGLGSKCDMKGN